MARRRLPIIDDPDSKKILRRLCKTHNLSLELVIQMVEIQRDNLGRGRQVGITQEFSAAIAEFLETQRGA
jgi:hypothetical protein